MKWMSENRWSIYNECMKRGEEEEYTFTGRKGNTTIDFVIGEGK